VREQLFEYSLLAEALPQLIWVSSPEGSAEYYNARWFEYTGLSEAETSGDSWTLVVHPDDLPTIKAKRAPTLESGDLFETEFRLRRRDGTYHWFLARAVPIRENGSITAWFGSSTDIDDQKRAENVLAFFARAGRVLGESLEPPMLGYNMARLVVPEHADHCEVYEISRDRLALLASVHTDPEKREILREIHARWPLDLRDEAIADIFRYNQPVIVPEITDAMRAAEAREPEHLALLHSLNETSRILLPLSARGLPCGLLSVGYVTSSGRHYAGRDLSFIQELGQRFALALDNAHRYQHEHRVAHALQEAMLEIRLPRVPGARLDSLYIPGESELQVGGDWFDAFELPNGTIALSIGDVTGHGLDAAVVMGELRQAMRSAAIEALTPANVLDHADRALRLQRSETIATAGFALYDPRERTLTYASAGHPAPMFCAPDGQVLSIEGHGLPLGLRQAGAGEEVHVTFDPGTMLVLYTDGLTEYNRDAATAEQKLREGLSLECADPAHQPAHSLYRRVVPINAPSPDDTAILTLQVE